MVGWFAGVLMSKVLTSFLLSNPTVMAKVPSAVLWLLGIEGADSPQVESMADELFEKCEGHMFTKRHITEGIMQLGSSKRDIFDKVFKIMSSKLSQAVNGSNQIYTTINGVKTTIRFFIENGKVINLNAMTDWASRIIGKLLK